MAVGPSSGRISKFSQFKVGLAFFIIYNCYLLKIMYHLLSKHAALIVEPQIKDCKFKDPQQPIRKQ
jgi:hypothetical protein